MPNLGGFWTGDSRIASTLLDLLPNSLKPPVELNIYSAGLPLKKGDGRGIIRGVGGINPFFARGLLEKGVGF
jgi:hypothetical protein